MDLISVTRRQGLSCAVKIRGHEIVTDMSAKEGGADEGPSPVELVVAAIGSCIATMVHRYCESHGYKDGEVAVSLTYELADNPKRIAAITIDLELPRDVPESRHVAIRRVAELCPVHQSLHQPPRLDLEIV